MITRLARFFTCGCFVGLMCACTNIECPLDNLVSVTIGMYDAENGKSFLLKDSLTVLSSPKDTILLNRAQGISSFSVPLRHIGEVDTFLLYFSNISQSATDTLFIKKTNHPHFESVDCPATFFHTLHKVEWTSHALSEYPLTIDSVVLSRSKVDYEDIENVKIYFRSTTFTK